MRGHLTPALGQSPSPGPCSVPALESPRASLKGARPRQLPALGTPLRASEGESIGRVPAWVILLPGASAVSGAVCGRYSSGRGGAPGIARVQPRGAAERPRTHRTAHSRELPSRQLCWAWGPAVWGERPLPPRLTKPAARHSVLSCGSGSAVPTGGSDGPRARAGQRLPRAQRQPPAPLLARSLPYSHLP